MNKFNKYIYSLILATLMSQNIKADSWNLNTLQTQRTFSGFICYEIIYGNSFKTIEHSIENGLEILTVKLWNLNELIETRKFQITSQQFQGGMLLHIDGVEMNVSMGTEFQKIELLMSTTQVENHSILLQPFNTKLSCQF